MRLSDVQEVEKKLGFGLPPVLRTLLVSDGTVTRFLEAYYQEEIQIQIQKHQEERFDPTSAIAANFSPAEKILIREVKLQGATSQRFYTSARSWLRLEHLDQEIQRAFEQKQWGIGELLNDRRVESYREILGYWIEGEGERQEIARSYRIWIRSEPTIFIEERFPLKVYFTESFEEQGER